MPILELVKQVTIETTSVAADIVLSGPVVIIIGGLPL